MFDSFSEIFASKLRLMVVSALFVGQKDFTTLKKLTGATDGNLGRQMEILVTNGFVNMTKESVGKRSRTTYCLSNEGRNALINYVDELSNIIGGDAGTK